MSWTYFTFYYFFKKVGNSPAATITSPQMNTSSNSEKTSDITSPPTENHPFGFGAGSGTRFDFFGSGGMFGGSSQETGNGTDFPAFNFTGLDSMNRTGGNDLGGFGFNF